MAPPSLDGGHSWLEGGNMATRRRRRFSALLPCLVLLASVSSSPLRDHSITVTAEVDLAASPALQPHGAVPTGVPPEGGIGRGSLTRPVEIKPVLPESWNPPEEKALNNDSDTSNNNTLGDFHHFPSTRKGPEEAFEATTLATSHSTPPPIPPLLQVLLRTTTTAVTGDEVAARTALRATTTPPQSRRLPLGITQAPRRPPPKSWFPPSRSNQHGGNKPRFGPYFEEGSEGSNVTARLGSTVLLDCKIGMLRDKTVTWLHRKDDAIHLLTVGRQAYSSDSRFSLAYRYPNNWRLQILFVSRRDEGFYECQVATHPPRIRQIFLRVTAPELKIVDEDYHEVLERYYKSGSQVELTCVATQLGRGDGNEWAAVGGGSVEASSENIGPGAETAGRVLWRHGDSAITQNSSDRGIWMNTSADRQNVSVTLTLRSTKKSDGGNYTCSVGGLASATVSIHILNGELPAAVQYGNSTVPFGAVSLLLQLWCLLMSLSTISR